jgi:hypothetical protein
MNSEFAAEAARRFAGRPDVTSLASQDERMERMWLLAFARRPTETEKRRALEFLGAERAAEQWEQLAQGLIMANEFIFID